MQINKMTIKITLAVFLSVLLGKLIGIQSPFYAGIAAVITLQSGFLDTIAAIKNRIAGTIIGIIIGMICSYFGQGSMFSCLVGIMITVAVCQTLKFDKSISVAIIIFLAININFYGTLAPSFYSLHRFIDTMIGIGVVVIVQLSDIALINFKEKLLHNNYEIISEVKDSNKIINLQFPMKKSA